MASLTCFTRQYRLLHSREFQYVFSNTHCKSADSLLTLLAVPNGRNHPRMGLAISKKRIKTAVARNRLKRLVRDSFRRTKMELPNIDVVVLGQSRAALATNQELFESLNQHWKKLTVRCKKSSSR